MTELCPNPRIWPPEVVNCCKVLLPDDAVAAVLAWLVAAVFGVAVAAVFCCWALATVGFAAAGAEATGVALESDVAAGEVACWTCCGAGLAITTAAIGAALNSVRSSNSMQNRARPGGGAVLGCQ
jgi:hypothetical protein